MNFSTQFQNILKNIDEIGSESQPRDMKVKELPLTTIGIDSYLPIANFESRKFNWKYFAGELAWYLRKDNDVDYIGQFSGFWSTLTNPNTNQINSNYGSLLFNEQLEWVVDSLKADKNSRQAIAFLNQPKFQFEGNKDFVCTMYLNFFIRNNQLHMKVQMRSNDVFYGLTFDAPFFAFVHQHVHLWLKDTYPELELGVYYHCADNTHFYERHFELAEEISKEDAENSAQHAMIISDPFFNIEAGKMLLTEHGLNFIEKVNETIETEKPTQADFKEILEDYVGIVNEEELLSEEDGIPEIQD
jgi:thymidylate synthase|tara:strand:+ start:793 stop:1695 length:903 start_codon:yes stop_codon:yes gene_type:complete